MVKNYKIYYLLLYVHKLPGSSPVHFSIKYDTSKKKVKLR